MPRGGYGHLFDQLGVAISAEIELSGTMPANHKNTALNLVGQFIELSNANAFTSFKRPVQDGVLDAFFQLLQEQGIKTTGHQVPVPNLGTIHFGIDENGIYCNFSTNSKRSEPRYADLQFDRLKQELYGPIDTDVAPAPGELYPRKDVGVVLAELLLAVGKEARAAV